MPATSLAPGTVIANRNRLWRADAHGGDVLVVTSSDGGEPEQLAFYVLFDEIRPVRLGPPSPDIAGNASAQDLLLRAGCLSLLQGVAPLSACGEVVSIPRTTS
jgi:hypothetical protein